MNQVALITGGGNAFPTESPTPETLRSLFGAVVW